VTCPDRAKEPRTVREVLDLLTEYADQLYPKAEEVDEGSASVEDALAAEIASLKKEQKGGLRRFYVLDTSVKGVIFIRFTDAQISPVPFITHILNDIKEKKIQKTKFAVRFLPIEKTCVVQMDKVLELVKTLSKPYFPPNPPAGQKKTFTVAFKRRNNDQVRQMDTIEAIKQLLADVGVLSYRDHEIVIVVEIFQRACGVGVIPNGEYSKLEGFNIRMIYEKEMGICQGAKPNASKGGKGKKENEATLPEAEADPKGECEAEGEVESKQEETAKHVEIEKPTEKEEDN